MLTWKWSPMSRAASCAVFGVAWGLFFGVSLNAFGHAAIGLEAAHLVYAVIVSF